MINSTPEIFIRISETLEKLRTPFKKEVKTPASITITPWPKEKQRSIKPANKRFLLNAAKPIIPASIGVEQGLAAKANRIPTIKG